MHTSHNPRFNHDLQLHIDSIEWVLDQIQVNKIPIDRLEGVIQATVKDLEDAMKREETDNLWTKIETLQWVM